jgi:N-acetylglucosaminylphosphatidylinositol deacetylase
MFYYALAGVVLSLAVSLSAYSYYARSVLSNHWIGLTSFPHMISLSSQNFLSSNEYSQRQIIGDSTAENGVKRVLLLTAHPDDETMFFAPTILALLRNYIPNGAPVELYIHCMSKGLNCGETRAKELREASPILGIPVERVFIDDLQDGANWSNEEVVARLDSSLKRWKIDTLITFDDYGVSGHKNHISCFHGAQQYLRQQNDPSKRVRTFVLRSNYIIPKYLAWLTFPSAAKSLRHRIMLAAALNVATVPGNHGLLFSNPDPHAVHRAMQAHESQYVWFRRLFVKFSQYVYWNSLELISL